MSYRIARGEQGVLTFEPYKSMLLPYWRFRTPDIARKSSRELWEKFKEFDVEEDFVGMDMARKFIQMVSCSTWSCVEPATLLMEFTGHDKSEEICQSCGRKKVR